MSKHNCCCPVLISLALWDNAELLPEAAAHMSCLLQQCTGGPITPHPCQHLVASGLQTFANLVGYCGTLLGFLLVLDHPTMSLSGLLMAAN